MTDKNRHQATTMNRRPSFTCPDCGRTSYHPKDVEFRYCFNCHVFVGDREEFEALRLRRMRNDLLSSLRDGHLWVASRQCASCPFSSPSGQEKLQQAAARDRLIICRDTLEGPRIVCHTLVESHSEAVATVFIAKAAGLIAYMEVPECPDSASKLTPNTPTSTSSTPPPPQTPE